MPAPLQNGTPGEQVSLRDTIVSRVAVYPPVKLAGYCRWSLRDLSHFGHRTSVATAFSLGREDTFAFGLLAPTSTAGPGGTSENSPAFQRRVRTKESEPRAVGTPEPVRAHSFPHILLVDARPTNGEMSRHSAISKWDTPERFRLSLPPPFSPVEAVVVTECSPVRGITSKSDWQHRRSQCISENLMLPLVCG